MSPEISPCGCGTPAPPSVTIDADGCQRWEATLECPGCGTIAVAVATGLMDALYQAMLQWNAVVGSADIRVINAYRCRTDRS